MGKAIVNYDFTDGQEIDLMSNIDGNIVKYAVEYSTMNTPNPNIIEDRNLSQGEIGSGDFYDADGENLGGDDFYDATGDDDDTFTDDSMPDTMVDEEYGNATGKKGKKRGKKRKGFFNRLLDVQSERQKMKFGAKDKMAQAQLESAKQQGALAQSDVATATALANASKSSGSNAKTSTTEKSGWSGLSKGAKIGIIVGGVAVLGVVAYFLMRKKK